MTDLWSIMCSHWRSYLSRQVRLLLFPVTFLRTDSETSTLVSIILFCVLIRHYPILCTAADDHTRVELKGDPDVEGSDYINASFIDVSLIRRTDIKFRKKNCYRVYVSLNHRATLTRNTPT